MVNHHEIIDISPSAVKLLTAHNLNFSRSDPKNDINGNMFISEIMWRKTQLKVHLSWQVKMTSSPLRCSGSLLCSVANINIYLIYEKAKGPEVYRWSIISYGSCYLVWIGINHFRDGFQLKTFLKPLEEIFRKFYGL